MTKEIVRAHESQKHFIPILIGISHAHFQRRQPEWREAIGSAASMRVEGDDYEAVGMSIARGLQALKVHPRRRPSAEELHFRAKAIFSGYLVAVKVCDEKHSPFEGALVTITMVSDSRHPNALQGHQKLAVSMERSPVSELTDELGFAYFSILPDIANERAVCVASVEASGFLPAHQSLAKWSMFQDGIKIFKFQGPQWALALRGGEVTDRDPDESLEIILISER